MITIRYTKTKSQIQQLKATSKEKQFEPSSIFHVQYKSNLITCKAPWNILHRLPNNQPNIPFLYLQLYYKDKISTSTKPENEAEISNEELSMAAKTPSQDITLFFTGRKLTQEGGKTWFFTSRVLFLQFCQIMNNRKCRMLEIFHQINKNKLQSKLICRLKMYNLLQSQ